MVVSNIFIIPLYRYVVSGDLRCIDTTFTGSMLMFGMADGGLTTLAVADPEKKDHLKFIRSLSSRQLND